MHHHRFNQTLEIYQILLNFPAKTTKTPAKELLISAKTVREMKNHVDRLFLITSNIQVLTVPARKV